MGVIISKRKLESYKRAEMVARELRYQLSSASYRDDKRLAMLCIIHWMKMTGDIKYDRPE